MDVCVCAQVPSQSLFACAHCTNTHAQHNLKAICTRAFLFPTARLHSTFTWLDRWIKQAVVAFNLMHGTEEFPAKIAARSRAPSGQRTINRRPTLAVTDSNAARTCLSVLTSDSAVINQKELLLQLQLSSAGTAPRLGH